MALSKHGGIALAEIKAMPPDEAAWWAGKLAEIMRRESEQ